jgi:sugar O-acyltransferase (sialic acid O-acetyltransferase NeuD family)
MKNILLYGASEHGKYTADIIEKEGKYRIIGFVDDSITFAKRLYGYSVLGGGNDLLIYVKRYNIYGGIVTIGDNFVRYKVVKHIKSVIPNFRFVKAVHPFTSIARDVRIGDGSVLMAGVIINSSSNVGKHCFLATKASLDHDGWMDDFSSLAPGVTTGGNVRIGEFSTVSIGANVKHGITIGKHTVIGAGATVVKNISSYVVAYGTPCRTVRERKKGEKYL